MSTKILSKEAEIRLMNFFNNRIDPIDMAKAIRQVNLTLALGVMNEEQNISSNASKLGDSFYWLNELAEILNPYLDLE
ncbi:hypothetical protein BSF41_24920 [Flavobacterium sp. ACN2]|uniref:hypothetical protein n=1 Tax=unclassified Flavobacterium TaxID=196869 RepID=UPI000BB2EEA0|nr:MULTISPECIES: hypothetical protein [unclassified Flavobacterium]MDY0988688.1 hypothetical protein [Flavobacterium sp. CFBP9031]PBI88364.1 hypothetical protein BSF41_24920 [Flavobacterium sp. ACN2]